MYVYYWGDFNGWYIEFYTDWFVHGMGPCFHHLTLTECCWMVPGTVTC